MREDGDGDADCNWGRQGDGKGSEGERRRMREAGRAVSWTHARHVAAKGRLPSPSLYVGVMMMEMEVHVVTLYHLISCHTTFLESTLSPVAPSPPFCRNEAPAAVACNGRPAAANEGLRERGGGWGLVQKAGNGRRRTF